MKFVSDLRHDITRNIVESGVKYYDHNPNPHVNHERHVSHLKLALYCSYRKRHNVFDVTLTDIFRIIVNTLIMKISIEEIRGKNTDNAQ
jgi:hypothetical protein